VRVLVEQFDDSLGVLRAGDPSRPLFVPWDDQVDHRFAEWTGYGPSVRAQWLAGSAADGRCDSVLRRPRSLSRPSIALVLSIEQQLSRLTAILNLFQLGMMALAIIGAVVMLFTGYMYVINPLGQLRQGLRRSRRATFAPASTSTRRTNSARWPPDFNRMAGTLQSLYDGLEAQVELPRPSTYRSAACPSGGTVRGQRLPGQANTIDELSQGFCAAVRAVMKADAVAVRWADEANQRYLMLASDCFPARHGGRGAQPVGRGMRLWQPAPDARTRVIPILAHEAQPVRSCAKAGFESLVSVPIRLQHRLLGEFDLFFRARTVTLSSEETELLDALASHLASALEGLRAAALEREAAVGEERACWRVSCTIPLRSHWPS
jgi:two-component system nitrate/nitrite sensor histidine kinase NarX